MNTIIILGVLLALLVILIVLREVEIRKQRRSFVTSIISRLDPFFARGLYVIFRGVSTFVSYFRILWTHYVIPFMNRILRHLHLKARRTVKKTQSIIKGERRLDNRGSVNFFFHMMSEDKRSYVSQKKKEK